MSVLLRFFHRNRSQRSPEIRPVLQDKTNRFTEKPQQVVQIGPIERVSKEFQKMVEQKALAEIGASKDRWLQELSGEGEKCLPLVRRILLGKNPIAPFVELPKMEMENEMMFASRNFQREVAIRIKNAAVEHLEVSWNGDTLKDFLLHCEYLGKDEFMEMLDSLSTVSSHELFEASRELMVECPDLFSEDLRFEMAKFFAERTWGFSKHIRDYNLGAESRYLVAHVAAEYFLSDTTEFFGNYLIEREDQRLELAFILSKVDPRFFEHVGNLTLSEDSLFTLLKEQCSSFTMEKVLKLLSIFPFSKNRKFEIALICVDKYKDFSAHVDKFELGEDQNYRLAQQAVHKFSSEVSKFIERYGLRNRNCYQIAQIASVLDREFFNRMQNYKLNKQQKRELCFSIDKTKLQQVLQHLDDFDLEENDVVEIFRKSVQQSLWDSKYVRNSNLSEKNRYQIAELAAKRWNLVQHVEVKNYRLSSDNEIALLRKCAKMMAKFPQSMRNYPVAEESKVELASIFARYFPNEVSLTIKDFSLKKEEDRFRVAKSYLQAISEREITQETINLFDETIKRFELDPQHEFYIFAQGSFLFSHCSHDKLLEIEKYPQELIPFVDHARGRFAERFPNLTKKIEETKNPQVRARLETWSLFLSVQEEVFAKVGMEEFLENIADQFDPKIRYYLTITFASQARGLQKEDYRSQNKTEKRLSLLKLVFSRFVHDEELKRLFDAKIVPFFTNKLFKDGKMERMVFRFIYQLSQEEDLSFAEKKRLLELIFEKDLKMDGTIRLVASYIKICEDLLTIGRTDLLKTPFKDFSELQARVTEYFKKVFRLESIDHFEEKYERAFGNTRKIQNFIRYAARLKSFKLWQDDPVLLALSTFITDLLEGRFIENRYLNSAHLDVALSDSKIREAWLMGIEKPISAYPVGKAAVKKETDFVELLSESIISHRHLGKDYEREYPLLVACLKKQMDAKDAMQKIQGVRPTGKRSEETLQLEKKLLLLLASKDEERNQVLMELKQMKVPSIAFLADIESFLIRYLPDIPYKENLKVVETDNPFDLFFLGDEVTGSCQRTDGDPDLNQALLGYVLDGKYRAVLIRNERGEIVARRVLRLLYDEVLKRPVLFIEKYYTRSADERLETILEMAAIEKAKSMKVPLVCGARSIQYPNPLVSLCGKAPYEYFDGTQDHWKTRERYEVHDCGLIYTPEQDN